MLFQKVDHGVVLRPYQRECLGSIADDITRHRFGQMAQGLDDDAIVNARLLVVLPVGAGKTVVFSQLPQLPDHRQTLVLAHREELIDQAANQLSTFNPHLCVGIEKAERVAPDDADIVVASVQTLGRKGSDRIKRFPPHHFSHLIIDEAHHSTASQYVNIMKYFQVGQPRGPVLIGVTATPFRGDGTPLANVYDKVTFGRTIFDLIEEGENDPIHGPYLSRVTGAYIRTDVDLSNLHIRMGDFAEGELAAAVNVDARNSAIISGVLDHAQDRRSILVFCVDKDHTRTLTEQFNKNGMHAEYILGETPTVVRRRLLSDFRSGRLRILVNCGVLTEGFDAPNCDCIVMGRPTRSPLLYYQCVGRGTRVFPGKKDCLILDVVDNMGNQRVQTIGDAFGVRGCDFVKEDVYEKSRTVKDATDAGVNIEDSDSIKDVERKKEVLEKLAKGTVYVKTHLEMADVFASSATPSEVERDSEFPWIKLSPEHYILPMMGGTPVELSRDALGMWSWTHDGERVTADAFNSNTPFKWADRNIKRSFKKFEWQAKSMKAKWRRAKASPKQREVLHKLGIQAQPTDLTKGAASSLIDYLMWFRKLARRAGAPS